MKHLLFIIGSLAIFASAELPSNIPDQKTRDNFEYIDGKANKAYSITKNFESATSTVTVSGWVDIGLEKKTCSSGSGANECTATCSTGKRLMSCNCAQVGTATQFYCGPSVWNDATENCRSYGSGVNTTAMAICARVK